MTDPYRTGHDLACPRCQDPLVVGDGSFVCGRDCGEWLPIEALQSLALDTELGTGASAPQELVARPCVVCRRDMEPRNWSGVGFTRCASHGCWIDARHRTGFHTHVAHRLEEEREIQQLADRLAYPEGRREIAVRLRALERRVELLEHDRDRRG